MVRKVVLPEPDGPVTATNSPSRTWIEKSRSAIGLDDFGAIGLG